MHWLLPYRLGPNYIVVTRCGRHWRRRCVANATEEPDYRKQSFHLGNGCNVDQVHSSKSGLAALALPKSEYKVRI
jgi:hypothetical protein